MVDLNSTLPIFLAEARKFSDGGFLAEYAWVIVVLPFIAALAITFFGKKLTFKHKIIFYLIKEFP